MGDPPAVLTVGDESVRMLSGGTGRRPPRALIEASLDWIDDPVGLLGDRPVAVADMWRSLVETLLGPRCEAVVVVHPADWSRTRVDRVVAAVNTVADAVEAVSADRWCGADLPAPGKGGGTGPRGRRRRSGWALAAVVAMTCVLAVGTWPRPAASTVVEGRIAIRIPAGWDARRVTGGPGSRRLQVTSPIDPAIALHLTSTYAPGTSLADAAGMLERAIAAERAGVFGDLQGEATFAGRPSVTYRETRPGRVITWIVVLAGATRIGIGCQSPPGRERDIRAACDDAVRSAREA